MSTTNTTSCGSQVWQLPTQDAACAAILKGNMTDVMKECCKEATPTKYDNGCGMYCLAQGQDVQMLSDCLMSKSGDYQGVFCNAAQNATATASVTSAHSTSSATGTKTGSSKASSSSNNAAFVSQPVSKTGLGVVAMLFCSALMAVFA